MRRIFCVIAMQVFLINSVLASEAAYVPARHFVPLPPPSSGLNQRKIINQQPAKFFSLTKVRYPMPIRSEKGNIAGGGLEKKGKELLSSDDIDNSLGKKENMSQYEAQQIISIFAADK